MPSWKKKKGDRNVYNVKSDYWNHCSKSNSKEEDRGSGTVVCVACV